MGKDAEQREPEKVLCWQVNGTSMKSCGTGPGGGVKSSWEGARGGEQRGGGGGGGGMASWATTAFKVDLSGLRNMLQGKGLGKSGTDCGGTSSCCPVPQIASRADQMVQATWADSFPYPSCETSSPPSDSCADSVQ